jgi:uncharacterized membrane protein YhdT
LTPERFKQLAIEALWLGFLVAIIWMVLRIVGLYEPHETPEGRK